MIFDLETLGLFSLIIVLLSVLVRSADLIEDGFVFLARRVGISEFFIGFVILSAMSSLPEFSIAINSNDTIPELSIANLFGASLILLTLVIGLYAVKFKQLEFKGRFGELEIIWGLGVVVLGVLTVIDRNLNWIDGIILITAYLTYLIHIYSIFKDRKKDTILNTEMVPATKVLKMLAKSVAGVVPILIASSLIVDTVIMLGDRAAIDEAFIGLFILGVGTNIPELTILYRAHDSSKQKLAIGNFIGSACINVFTLGVLGILGQNINISQFNELIPVLFTLAGASILFIIFSWTGRTISRTEGLILIGLYISLVIFETTGILFNWF